MQRLTYMFRRRRVGHPAPIWRARAYRPTIDIRLADMHERAADHDRWVTDEAPSRPSILREPWER